MSFSCHLESVDSVRTSPSSPQSERHSNRLFAEAFTRLLFGEQLRFGQVPLVDSHGLARFFAEYLQARQRYMDERLRRQQAAAVPLPLVMTHFPGLRRDHQFEVPEQVFAETVANRVGSDNFILSSLPSINGEPAVRRRVAQWLDQCVTTGFEELPSDLERDIGSWRNDVDHLRRLAVIDRYFRRDPGATTKNDSSRNVKLRDALRVAVTTGRTNFEQFGRLSEFYANLVERHAADPPDLSRTEVYVEIERRFGQHSDAELARELVNSMYMWIQARVAAARTEATSSGLETDDDELKRLGEQVNQWADASKKAFGAGLANETVVRPVLQRGYLVGVRSLSNDRFRGQLLDGLADLLARPEYQLQRDLAWTQVGKQPGHVIEFWQKMAARVNEHEAFQDLLRVTVTTHGIVNCQFNEAVENGVCHQLGTLADGLMPSPETVDQIRESLETVTDAADREGNLLPLRAGQ